MNFLGLLTNKQSNKTENSQLQNIWKKKTWLWQDKKSKTWEFIVSNYLREDKFKERLISVSFWLISFMESLGAITHWLFILEASTLYHQVNRTMESAELWSQTWCSLTHVPARTPSDCNSKSTQLFVPQKASEHPVLNHYWRTRIFIS